MTGGFLSEPVGHNHRILCRKDQSNIKMISTSEIKISCIIDRADADKAVSAIHDMLFD